MGRYSNILICSDLDGTLLNSRGELSHENLEAIESFCGEGGKFCISTGRLPSHLLGFVKKDFFKCPIICCNGACIYDFEKEKILYERPLGDKVFQLCEFIFANSEKIVSTTLFAGLNKVSVKGFKEGIDVIRETIKEPVYKIVMGMENAGCALDLKDMLTDSFGEYFNFSRSWDVGVEILERDATKGHTVKRLKQILGKNYTSICVGDYENDITMIENADIGCAVANAIPKLRAAADRVICSNDEHAIKYIVENICDKL